MSNTVNVHIAAEVDDDPFTFGCQVKILLMGSLHPLMPPASTSTSTSTHEQRTQHAQDLSVTLNSLGREAWCPYETMARVHRTPDRIPLPCTGMACGARRPWRGMHSF